MIKLDAIDLRILAALQRDGRMTKLKLAETVHLSPTPCWERLRRLEQAGIIAGYTARVDLDRLVRLTTVLVEVTLKNHTRADFERFEMAIHAEPQIIACDATGGGIDYMLRVVAPDIDAYQRLIDRLLVAEIGIARYFTYVVTRPVKRAEAFPVERLVGTASG